MTQPIEIDVWQGEIAELEVDALVVAANESLFMTGGPAASVKRHGGETIERDAVDQGPIKPGAAVATHAGSLAAGYVIHAVGVGHDRRGDADQLRAALRAALAFAEPLQLRRIAFSLVGVEHGSFVPGEAADVLLEQLAAAPRSAGLPDSVVIATANGAETNAVREALARRRAQVA